MSSITGMSAQQSSLQALQQFLNGSNGPKGSGGPQGPGRGQNPLMKDAASILGIDSSTLQKDLQSGQSLASVANSSGMSTQDFLKQLESKAKSHMDEQVQNGTMTSDQETQMLNGLDSHLSDMINQTKQSQAQSAYQSSQNQMSPPPSPFSDAASILGIDTSTLKSDLESGKSLADIANSQGISTQDFLTQMEAKAKSNMDSAVQNGMMTSNQETSMLSNVNSFLTSLISQTAQSTSSTSSTSSISLSA